MILAIILIVLVNCVTSDVLLVQLALQRNCTNVKNKCICQADSYSLPRIRRFRQSSWQMVALFLSSSYSEKLCSIIGVHRCSFSCRIRRTLKNLISEDSFIHHVLLMPMFHQYRNRHRLVQLQTRVLYQSVLCIVPHVPNFVIRLFTSFA